MIRNETIKASRWLICLICIVVLTAGLSRTAPAYWVYETLDSTGDVGNDIAISLDPDDHPFIAYTQYVTGDRDESYLKMAHYNGSDWIIETICSDGDKGHSPSIVLDVATYPHITHWDIAGSVICRTWFDGSVWQTEILDSTPGTGEHSCLVMDDTNRLRVAYSSFNEGLKVATREASEWIFEIVDETSSLYLGNHPSMCMDSFNRAHIAYYGGHADYSIRYAWNDGSQWQTRILDADQYLNFPCMVLDELDQVTIAYANWQTWSIKMAIQTGPGPDFTIETLWPGYACSGLIRTSNRLHVLWSGDGLFYSFRPLTSSTWTTEQVAEADELGLASAMAVDSEERVYIAYDHDSNGDLILAYRTEEEATPTPTQECLHHGDVNLSGDVTAGDVQIAFQIALGLYPPTYLQACAADCNGDDDVTVGDAQGIFMTALGSVTCVDWV